MHMKPCTWNVPKRTKKASPIQEIQFVKKCWGKEVHQCKSKSFQHKLIKKDSSCFLDEVKKLEAQTGMKTGLLKFHSTSM